MSAGSFWPKNMEVVSTVGLDWGGHYTPK